MLIVLWCKKSDVSGGLGHFNRWEGGTGSGRFPDFYNLTFASSSENLWQSGSEVLNLQESKFSEVEIPNVTLSQICPQFGAESQVYAVRSIAVSFKQSAGQIVLISGYGSITHEARPHLIPVHLINN